MSDVKSLLPFNADQGLRDFEQATARLAAMPVDINTLWSPAKCPEHLLGWLAWALSVDVWDQTWSVETKREVLAQSVKVHRIKGTKEAVMTALVATGFEVEIREWFETDGAPYTFQIDAYGDDVIASGGGINTRTYNLVKRLIEHVKPARAHFDFRIGERFESDVEMRMGTHPQYSDALDHDPMPPTETPQAEFASMSAMRAISLSQITHIAQGRAA